MISNINSFCPVGIGGVKNINTDTTKLFIGNLPSDISSQDLYDYFHKYGEIREAVVIPDRFRVRSRCYGFVTFVEESITNYVLQLGVADSIKLNNNLLHIVLASTNVKPKRSNFELYSNTKKKVSSVNRTSMNSNLIQKEFGLYRTANIQTIEPATLKTPPKQSKRPKYFIKPKEMDNSTKKFRTNNKMPNNDIAYDYKQLLQINGNKNNIDLKEFNENAKDFVPTKTNKSPKRKRSTSHKLEGHLQSPKKRRNDIDDSASIYFDQMVKKMSIVKNSGISSTMGFDIESYLDFMEHDNDSDDENITFNIALESVPNHDYMLH